MYTVIVFTLTLSLQLYEETNCAVIKNYDRSIITPYDSYADSEQNKIKQDKAQNIERFEWEHRLISSRDKHGPKKSRRRKSEIKDIKGMRKAKNKTEISNSVRKRHDKRQNIKKTKRKLSRKRTELAKRNDHDDKKTRINLPEKRGSSEVNNMKRRRATVPANLRRQKDLRLSPTTDPPSEETLIPMGRDETIAPWLKMMTVSVTFADRVTVEFGGQCNITRDNCMLSYKIGAFCARTVYNTYNTFDNYCVMDYVNCLERYDLWQAIHMGPCLHIEPFSEYVHYPYQDDYFFDRNFIIEEI